MKESNTKIDVGACFCGQEGPVRKFRFWHAEDDYEQYEAPICDEHYGGTLSSEGIRHCARETKRRQEATQACS